MDEEMEGAAALKQGETVLIVSDSGSEAGEERFIGVLTSLDDLFLSAKVSHEWKLVKPMILPESAKKLREKLSGWKTAMLRLQVGVRYRILPVKQSREELVELLAEWMEQSALAQVDPVKTYVTLPMGKHISLAVSDVRKIESLTDNVNNEILKHLDFEPELDK